MKKLKEVNNCTDDGTWLEQKHKVGVLVIKVVETWLPITTIGTNTECPLSIRCCAQDQRCKDKGMCFIF